MASLTTTAGKTTVKEMNTAYALPTTTALVALSATDDAGIYTASTKTMGALLPFEGVKNRRLLVKIDNGATSAATIYVKAGTNTVTGAMSDLALSVPGSGSVICEIETGKYGQLEGTYKGNIVFVGAASTLKVGYIELA